MTNLEYNKIVDSRKRYLQKNAEKRTVRANSSSSKRKARIFKYDNGNTSDPGMNEIAQDILDTCRRLRLRPETSWFHSLYSPRAFGIYWKLQSGGGYGSTFVEIDSFGNWRTNLPPDFKTSRENLLTAVESKYSKQGGTRIGCPVSPTGQPAIRRLGLWIFVTLMLLAFVLRLLADTTASSIGTDVARWTLSTSQTSGLLSVVGLVVLAVCLAMFVPFMLSSSGFSRVSARMNPPLNALVIASLLAFTLSNYTWLGPAALGLVLGVIIIACFATAFAWLFS
ncbi:hypothetical protein [Tomitella cavernea]|uniref:hypothetical protein n=1 Tax=Tomitella cavernea TaxID=1387982 RepID=UPI00190847C4|nr:hypothetical protein [Tomitella cavernea]